MYLIEKRLYVQCFAFLSYPFMTIYLSAAVLFGLCGCANTHARYIFYYVAATCWWIISQPIMDLLFRCDDRAEFWTSCCLCSKLRDGAEFKYNVLVDIIFMLCERIATNPFIYNVSLCCSTSDRKYTCVICILLCRSYVFMNCYDSRAEFSTVFFHPCAPA